MQAPPPRWPTASRWSEAKSASGSQCRRTERSRRQGSRPGSGPRRASRRCRRSPGDHRRTRRGHRRAIGRHPAGSDPRAERLPHGPGLGERSATGRDLVRPRRWRSEGDSRSRRSASGRVPIPTSTSAAPARRRAAGRPLRSLAARGRARPIGAAAPSPRPAIRCSPAPSGTAPTVRADAGRATPARSVPGSRGRLPARRRRAGRPQPCVHSWTSVQLPTAQQTAMGCRRPSRNWQQNTRIPRKTLPIPRPPASPRLTGSKIPAYHTRRCQFPGELPARSPSGAITRTSTSRGAS